jgi:hypothetical protein
MDIKQSQFWKELLPILTHISNAKFIAIDLEMSGIATRSRFGPNPQGHDNGKPSLQALYEETRAAAELYQVLQIGITCVEEDRDKGELLFEQPHAYHANYSRLWQHWLTCSIFRVLSRTSLQHRPKPFALPRESIQRSLPRAQDCLLK